MHSNIKDEQSFSFDVKFLASHHFDTWHFGKRNFGTDISSPGHFCTCMFQPYRLTGTWTFQHKDFWAWGRFGTKNFWHHGCFGTWIFWHLAKQYGRFGTDILAPVLLYQNFHVPKSPCVFIMHLSTRWSEMHFHK